MKAKERAQAEYDLPAMIKAVVSPETYEVYAEHCDRSNRWSQYQSAVIAAIDAATHMDDPQESLATIRAKLAEYSRACERLGDTLDADLSIPA